MFHFARLGLALSASILLVACLGKTTSLGSAEGSQASAGTGTGADDGGFAAAADGGDGGTPARQCLPSTSPGGYSWEPSPASEPCSYLLPTGPSPNGDPNFAPATWDPVNVRVVTNMPGTKDVGSFVGMASACGDSFGWYYGPDRSPDGTPIAFFICPRSCEEATANGFLLLDAICPQP